MAGATKPLTSSSSNRTGPRRYQITITNGPGSGRNAEVEGRMVVGAGDGATFVVTDESVSRNHLELEVTDAGLKVRDLGSTNGTFLGGARIQTMTVHEEALITIGTTVLQLEVISDGVPQQRSTFGKLLGRSAGMQLLFGTLERAAGTDSTVLILGETGTGKEVIAHTVHERSARKDRPFVVVDCGSMAANLIESELFGHAKGAFTGASSERKGAFLEADGGTVFLDEVGELPLELQPRLLRVLESGTVKRLGDDQPRKVDVRIIAATHRDLEDAVKKGTFRRDLYFRLAVVIARVPPLRERPEDIPLLVRQFVAAMGRGDFELSEPMRRKLSAHDWPGNVRELRNVIERALNGGTVEMRGPAKGRPARAAPQPGEDLTGLPFKDAKEKLVDAFTREYITTLLDRNANNVSETAKAAGLARNYVHRLVNKFGLKGDE
ncbi:MAG: sigma 54-dependent Fis family transcriptional regulator [Archangiaceae bacterium]|nr:sigma 54-dependent Fis family transcriptional regulator [Archangiaceae bacterium]